MKLIIMCKQCRFTWNDEIIERIDSYIRARLRNSRDSHAVPGSKVSMDEFHRA